MIRKEIHQGMPLPRGYGIAYIDWNACPYRVAVCYPVPLNLLVSFLRDVWAMLVRPSSHLDRVVQKMLADTRREAFNEGYELGTEHGRQLSQLRDLVKRRS